jgi:crossover junction endodeoxyribonuclease RuvC
MYNDKSPSSPPARLAILFNEFNCILDTWNPLEAGMECLYFAKNVTSALPVSEARGVLSLALELRGISLGEYQPKEIKQTVVGTAAAEKQQVQELVRILLGLPEIPKPDHAADALGAAICRAHELPALVQATNSGL